MNNPIAYCKDQMNSCGPCQKSLKMFLIPSAKADVPPSAVTRPICGIMGTIRLVAGRHRADAV